MTNETQDYPPVPQERLEAIAALPERNADIAVRMAVELIARREWARAAHQFMWAHEHDCPRRNDGVCNCGLDAFLGRPREAIQTFKDEIEAMRKDREVAFALIGKLQAVEESARRDGNRPIGVQMALADLWLWRERQTR